MRQLIVSLLSATRPQFASDETPAAKTACTPIREQFPAGTFDGTICVSGATITLTGTATLTVTGQTFTIEATGTISGPHGNRIVSGTAIISDGTNTQAITVTSSGNTLLIAATGFLNKTITLALPQV